MWTSRNNLSGKKQKQKEKKEGGLHTPCLIVYGLDLSANWTGTRLRFKFTIGPKIRKKEEEAKDSNSNSYLIDVSAGQQKSSSLI